MGYSHAQKAETRQKILELAAKQIRTTGIDGLAIGDLMKRAGLTVGGFYNHFESRDDLILEATKFARSEGKSNISVFAEEDGSHTLDGFIDAYFDAKHIADPSTGCVLCALVGEGRHSDTKIRKVLTAAFDEQVDYISSLLKGKGARSKAIGIMTTIVGAVNVARAMTDPDSAQAILSDARKLILNSI